MAATAVEIINPEIIAWYTNQTSRDTALQAATVTILLAAVAQMGFYYNEMDRRLDERDKEVDAIVDFTNYIQGQKHAVDVPMLREKRQVLNLNLPPIQMCADIQYWAVWNASVYDGRAIDKTSERLVAQSAGGNSIPPEWGLHEGQMLQARAMSNAGGLIANAAKREREWFIRNKNVLVAKAQQNSKAPINANDILTRYAQAMTIHSSLADLYMSGFGSAGATAGMALSRLSSMHSSTGTSSGSGGSE